MGNSPVKEKVQIHSAGLWQILLNIIGFLRFHEGIGELCCHIVIWKAVFKINPEKLKYYQTDIVSNGVFICI